MKSNTTNDWSLHKKLSLKIAYELLWGLHDLTNVDLFSDMYDNKNHRWIVTQPEGNSFHQNPVRLNHSWEIFRVHDSIVWMSGNIEHVKFSFQKNQWSDPELILTDCLIMRYSDYKHSRSVFAHIKNISERIIQFLITNNPANDRAFAVG